MLNLRILCSDVHRSSDEKGVVAAGNGFVKAAFFAQVGAEDLQGAKCLQLLEVRVLGHVIWIGIGVRSQISQVTAFRFLELQSKDIFSCPAQEKDQPTKN